MPVRKIPRTRVWSMLRRIPSRRNAHIACQVALVRDPPSKIQAITCTLAPCLSAIMPISAVNPFSRIVPTVGKITQSLCRLLCHFPRKLLVKAELNREAYEHDKGNGKIQLPKLDITQESPVCNGQE